MWHRVLGNTQTPNINIRSKKSWISASRVWTWLQRQLQAIPLLIRLNFPLSTKCFWLVWFDRKTWAEAGRRRPAPFRKFVWIRISSGEGFLGDAPRVCVEERSEMYKCLFLRMYLLLSECEREVWWTAKTCLRPSSHQEEPETRGSAPGSGPQTVHFDFTENAI